MPRPALVLVTLLVAAAWAPPEARAADDRDTRSARSHLRAGAAYYEEARYDDALREMETAYRLRPLPELQYNIAQCHERLGHAREAAAAYRRYLDGKADAEDRAEVAERIKRLEERTDRPAGAPAPAPTVVEKEKIVLKEVVVYRDAPPKPGRSARIVAAAVGVLGLGALGTGIGFAVAAKVNADDVSAGGDPQHPVPFDGTLALAQSDGRQDRAVSLACFAVATLAAGGAVGLLVLGSHVDKEASKLAAQASLAPAPLPGGGGLVLAGRFQ